MLHKGSGVGFCRLPRLQEYPNALVPVEQRRMCERFPLRYFQGRQRGLFQVRVEHACSAVADHVERPGNWKGCDRHPARQRLELHDAGLQVFDYGLGIMRAGTELGHEGEAIGWEGWAGHDPDTGETAVVFTNTCADSGALFSALAVLDPGFQDLADLVDP